MPVTYTFGSASAPIPLSQLDSNFATPITLGNTAIQLGNTVTTLNNMTFANATISSGNVTATTVTANTVTSPAATALTIQSAGTTAMTIDTSQNVGIGTSAGITLVSSGLAINNATAANYPGLEIQTAGVTRMLFNANNAASYISSISTNPLVFATNGSERMRIDSSGNVLVTNVAGLGYGTGSGGTVTQATSKTTNVTLNKPTGQITMNNAALASGATASFTVNNSVIAATDTVNVQVAQSGVYTASNYRVNAYPTAGNFIVSVTNWSGGSLSEAIVLNFAIVKGATS